MSARVGRSPVAGPAVAAARTVSTSSARRFARRARLRRWRRVRPAALLGVGLLTALALAWLLWASPVLAVRSVTVSGATPAQAAAVRQAVHSAVGEPMLRVSTTALRDAVESLPGVAAATVSRHWPSTLVVALDPRRAVALIVDGSSYVLVSADGTAFATTAHRPAGLPVLSGIGTAQTDRLAAAATVAAALPPALAKQVLTISASTPDSVRLSLTGGRSVVWGDASASGQKATVLDVLMSHQKARVYDVSAPAAPTTQQ